MAEKKHYLIKVWDTSIKKNKKLDKSIETSSDGFDLVQEKIISCLLYTSPSPRDRTRSRMPSSA